VGDSVIGELYNGGYKQLVLTRRVECVCRAGTMRRISTILGVVAVIAAVGLPRRILMVLDSTHDSASISSQIHVKTQHLSDTRDEHKDKYKSHNDSLSFQYA
jgi:hypothetical protein